MLQFRWSARSHVGRVRSNNEDSGFAGPFLMVIADGVGGAEAGEVASASTTYVLAASSMIAPDADPIQVLRQAVDTSFHHLRQGVADDARRRGMATTLTAVLTDGSRFALAHVGDSRAYVVRDQRLRRITQDHTLVQLLVDDNRITVDEARTHPQRSVVLQSVDAVHPPEPDLVWLDVDAGDRLLLCSDGLTDRVTDERIEQVLDTDDLDAAVATLVSEALAAGGRDNVTCLVADIVDAALVGSAGELVGAARVVGNLIDAAAVRSPQSA